LGRGSGDAVNASNSDARWIAMGGLALAALLWASSFVVLKAAMVRYHPYMLIFGRLMVASVCFVPLFYRRRHLRPKPGALKYILLMAVCEPCLYFLFETAALQRTTASQAGMITAMLPLMVAVGAYLFLSERLTLPTLVGFSLAIVGAVWLSLTGEVTQSAPNPVWGNFLEFLAMICATGYILCVKRLTAGYGYSPLMITAVQALAGFVFYLPLIWLPSIDFSAHWEVDFLWAILYLGAFITMGAYGLYNYGISRVTAGQAAAFINLIPIFSVLLGWFFLDERFTPPQYLAAAVILLGIYLSQRGVPRHRSRMTPRKTLGS
jgi:drug/metabolite transporter (DMT)-like permease